MLLLSVHCTSFPTALKFSVLEDSHPLYTKYTYKSNYFTEFPSDIYIPMCTSTTPTTVL